MWHRNFIWKISSLLLGGGVAFLFQIATMRYLGPTGYGYWSLAIGWAGLFAVVVDYGFNPLLSRDIARHPQEAQSYLYALIKGKLLLALAAGVCLIATWRYLPAVSLSGSLLAFAFVYLCTVSTAESLQAITYALEYFRLGAFLSIFQKMVPALTGFCVIAIGGSENHLFFSLSSVSVLCIVLTFIFINRYMTNSKSTKSYSLMPLLTAGLPLFFQNLFIMVYFRVDTLMIGHYTNPAQAGIYSAAYRFFELSNVIPTALMAAWIAPLSKEIETDPQTPMFYAALKVFFQFALAGVLLLEGIAWISPYVLGAAYAAAAPVLHYLSFTLIFYYPNFLLTTMLVILGRPSLNTLLAGSCMIFNVLINIWAIPRWGVTAAAFTTLATEGLLFGLSAFAVFTLRRAYLIKAA